MRGLRLTGPKGKAGYRESAPQEAAARRSSPMSLERSSQLEWISPGAGALSLEDLVPAPGQLEPQDFLQVTRVGFSARADRWKWTGFRGARAPHGFEGVSASREAARLAAEQAYFAD